MEKCTCTSTPDLTKLGRLFQVLVTLILNLNLRKSYQVTVIFCPRQTD